MAKLNNYITTSWATKNAQHKEKKLSHDSKNLFKAEKVEKMPN